MFVCILILVASVFATGQDAEPKSIYARLGWPEMEICEHRIHVGKGGKWTTHLMQAYRVDGMSSEELNEFMETLAELAPDSGAKSFRRSEVEKGRLQFDSKGKSDDSLRLASLLVEVFEEDECDFLHWDRKSFEWRFSRDEDSRSSREENKSIGDFFSGMALGIVFSSVIDKELKQKGVTQAEFESAVSELPVQQLVLTTDGKITADSPAEVSDDGKTLTLDLSKFLSDPPKNWSVRIDGL